MKTRSFEGGRLIRLEREEMVMKTLVDFLEAENIRSGTITGLGGIADAELGFYDLAERIYRKQIVTGNLELVHFGGNISVLEDRPFIHAHAVVSGPDFIPRSGHFFEARVTITGEFVLRDAEWDVWRGEDSYSGLKLLDLA